LKATIENDHFYGLLLFWIWLDIRLVLLCCGIGSLIGGILLYLKIVKRRQPIPFGPYLALGSLIAYGYGSDLIHFYLSILDNGMRN
jgi:leader peptidase (prepilin peptidase)/N-methyltransferase